MRDPETAIRALGLLRDQGVHISVDDFGTGYSSLSYLKQLPVECLKIDQGFVDGLAKSNESAAIVKAVIALAEALGLTCIAEGVEMPEQLLTLQVARLPSGPGIPLRPPVAGRGPGSVPVRRPGRWQHRDAFQAPRRTSPGSAPDGTVRRPNGQSQLSVVRPSWRAASALASARYRSPCRMGLKAKATAIRAVRTPLAA